MANFILIHPLVAITVVLLCYTNAYLGIGRHLILGGRRGFYIMFKRNAHITIGRIFIVLTLLAFPLGILGIRQAGFPAFGSLHAYLGLILVILFSYGASLGIRTLKGEGDYIKKHGRIMLTGALFLILQILGGIENLKKIGIL
jgi:hypothetical protein